MQRSAYGLGLTLATALTVASCGGGSGARPDPELDSRAGDEADAATPSSVPDGRAPTATIDGRAPVGDPGDARADGSVPPGDGAVRDVAPPDPGTYDPCPAKGTACRIMPLGDSITDGAGSSGGGYRVPLFRLSLKEATTITFVGTASNGPATVDTRPFPRAHEGHSGFTIDTGGGRPGLSPLVANAITMTKPHIVLLMIGTNDIAIQLDLKNAPTRLGALMDKIVATNPDLLLVVAQIVPTTNDAANVRVKAYNDAIPALVKARADAGKHVVMVDMYGGFQANPAYKTVYMNDNLHPKDAGYARMAEIWYPAIGRWLK